MALILCHRGRYCKVNDSVRVRVHEGASQACILDLDLAIVKIVPACVRRGKKIPVVIADARQSPSAGQEPEPP
ncbi:unnamed protein product, partial [Amoebophrya sp. A120]|eukprot:GSA120T00003696001.1